LCVSRESRGNRGKTEQKDQQNRTKPHKDLNLSVTRRGEQITAVKSRWTEVTGQVFRWDSNARLFNPLIFKELLYL
jgi:hypothetical protein